MILLFTFKKYAPFFHLNEAIHTFPSPGIMLWNFYLLGITQSLANTDSEVHFHTRGKKMYRSPNKVIQGYMHNTNFFKPKEYGGFFGITNVKCP